MRILILGAGGMLGHKLYQALRSEGDVEVFAAARKDYSTYARFGLFDPERFVTDVDAANPDALVRALGGVHADVMVNCIGIVKQAAASRDPVASLTVNALLPHRLAAICRAIGARLIHISTDCVFSGRKGGYTETDFPDADDLYGRTKLLGEVIGPGCLTVRTSLIGRELYRQTGLLEWFLANRGKRVQGYTNAIFSGFTTLALAELLSWIIRDHAGLWGLYHVASEPISKYTLLCKIRELLGLSTVIEPETEYRCDRSLDASPFRAAVGVGAPTWDAMVEALAADPTPYELWRRA